MNPRVFWQHAGITPRSALTGDAQCKYLIVGGGIVGLMTAFYLHKNGASDIVIIDRSYVGSGATGYSAGMLVTDPEMTYTQMLEAYGPEFVKRHNRMQEEIIAELESVTANYPRVGFTRLSTLILAEPEQVDSLKREAEILEKAGRIVYAIENPSLGAIRYPFGIQTSPTASVNPLELARSLGDYLERQGVRIFENTTFTTHADGKAHTDKGVIDFTRLILAIDGSPKDEGVYYATSIGITEPLADIPTVLRDNVFFEWRLHGYRYGKLTGDNRLLMGTGDAEVQEGTLRPSMQEQDVAEAAQYVSTLLGAPTAFPFAWSAHYYLPKGVAYWHEEGSALSIGGSGTQLSGAVVARCAAEYLLGRTDLLINTLRDLPD